MKTDLMFGRSSERLETNYSVMPGTCRQTLNQTDKETPHARLTLAHEFHGGVPTCTS